MGGPLARHAAAANEGAAPEVPLGSAPGVAIHAKCHLDSNRTRYRIFARPSIDGVVVVGVQTGSAAIDTRQFRPLTTPGTGYLVNTAVVDPVLGQDARVLPVAFTLVYSDGSLRDVRMVAYGQLLGASVRLLDAGSACGFTQISHEQVSR